MFKVQMFLSPKTDAEFMKKEFSDRFETWGDAQLFAADKANEMKANVTATNDIDVRYKESSYCTEERTSGLYKIVALDEHEIPQKLIGEVVILEA